jgi:hypothetical protein
MPSEEQIRELAYSIWEQEGRPDGKDMDHYMRARQILEAREAEKAAFKTPAVVRESLPSKPLPTRPRTNRPKRN